MSSENQWLVPNQVIYSHPSGAVTLADLSSGNEEILVLLKTGYEITQKPIHLIVDTSSVITQPSPLETRRVFTYMRDPRLGWTMVGGLGNPLLYFFTKLVSSFIISKTVICPTLEHALDQLRRKDPSLPDLLVEYAQKKAAGDLA